MPLKGAYSKDELAQRIARAEIAVDRLRAENERLRSENAELRHELDAVKAILQREVNNRTK